MNKKNIKSDEIKCSKTKISAVLLVIFFGIFGWLYTVKKSAGKFIVGFFVLLGIFSIYLMWSNVIILFMFYIASFAMWVWAIVDIAIKPEIFFTEYPNE